MNEEIWKYLPIGNNKYEISNYGNVKTHYLSQEGRLLTIITDRLGYKKVHLRIDGKPKQYCVHCLVALMFVPNPFMYNEINHIDGNKANNYYENLEWCTHSQNMKHAFATGLNYMPTGSEHHSAKSFFQFDLKGNVIKHWNCIRECAEYLFEHDEQAKKEFANPRSLAANISHTLNRKHQTCCGYNFGFNIKAPNIIYKTKEKPVIATDIKTGEKIYFSGVRKTEGYVMPNGKKAIATIVSKCCKGKRNTHAGYYWGSTHFTKNITKIKNNA